MIPSYLLLSKYSDTVHRILELFPKHTYGLGMHSQTIHTLSNSSEKDMYAFGILAVGLPPHSACTRASTLCPFRWPLWSHMGCAQLWKWVRGRPAAPSVVPGCRRLCAHACAPHAALAGVGARRHLAANLMAGSPQKCGIARLVGISHARFASLC